MSPGVCLSWQRSWKWKSYFATSRPFETAEHQNCCLKQNDCQCPVYWWPLAGKYYWVLNWYNSTLKWLSLHKEDESQVLSDLRHGPQTEVLLPCWRFRSCPSENPGLPILTSSIRKMVTKWSTAHGRWQFYPLGKVSFFFYVMFIISSKSLAILWVLLFFAHGQNWVYLIVGGLVPFLAWSLDS